MIQLCGAQIRFIAIIGGKKRYLCRDHYNALPDLSPEDVVVPMSDGETIPCDYEVYK